MTHFDEDSQSVTRIEPSAELMACLAASGFVGTWRWSIPDSLLWLDQGLSDLLLHDPSLAGLPLSSSETQTSIYPDDLKWLTSRVTEAIRAHKDIRVVFRATDRHGAVRHIRVAGAVSRDSGGTPLSARGIAMDSAEEPAPTRADDLAADWLLTAADHLLLVRRSVPAGLLASLVDMALLEAGKLLASSIQKEHERALL